MPAAEEIRAAVKQRFAQVARSPDQETKFPVGPASARRLGYDPQEIDALPPSVTGSFCGVGNPLGLGEVCPDQDVLDLGSGPGLDGLRHDEVRPEKVAHEGERPDRSAGPASR